MVIRVVRKGYVVVTTKSNPYNPMYFFNETNDLLVVRNHVRVVDGILCQLS